ncbi:chemotaxis protein CheW [Pseudomonas sp.]|uniref:chemotaxis protein CheW n=1 Tax=Pseudomonas sp. TaxID=306 RepID=UPI002C06738D|nr:chemotaxis protein CheW [Pseudomonas sp.]HUE94962.1 chemotaxis protein CheW [Pseudomonas sp.]
MLAVHHPQIDTTAEADRLFLLFSCAGVRYGLDVGEVAEVLAQRRLQPVAQAPVWVAGIFSYRGSLVPVLDLSALLAGQPAARRTSTRIVLVHYRRADGGPSHLLGLLVERAGETLRCAPSEFHDYGLDNPHAAYLGPVYQGPQGLVQWVGVQALLPAEAHALLFPDEPDAAAQEAST